MGSPFVAAATSRPTTTVYTATVRLPRANRPGRSVRPRFSVQLRRGRAVIAPPVIFSSPAYSLQAVRSPHSSPACSLQAVRLPQDAHTDAAQNVVTAPAAARTSDQRRGTNCRTATGRPAACFLRPIFAASLLPSNVPSSFALSPVILSPSVLPLAVYPLVDLPLTGRRTD